MTNQAPRQPSSYHGYWAADFNRPQHYPPTQTLPAGRYQPVGQWMGRLILPAHDQREQVMGTLFEVYHTAPAHKDLVGQIVRLRWRDDLETNARMWGVTQPVFFDDSARKTADGGAVLPERLDQRGHVNPFESLAGSHPHDDLIVRLHEPVAVEFVDGECPILYTPRVPVQITGRYYALARFLAPDQAGSDLYKIVHFNRQSGAFDGPGEVVRLPRVVPDINNLHPSVNREIERSPVNESGWYLFGAQDHSGVFTVQALAPRALLRRRPDQCLVGQSEAKRYLSPSAWRKSGLKGTVQSTLLCPDGAKAEECLAEWQEGDSLLLVHLYGGIGGPKAERAARGPVYWGHFAFGIAHIVREPLAGELIFDIEYHQVYAHNPDGLTAGTIHWSRYAGDRQYGWLGLRPIQDILIKLDCFTNDFEIGTLRRSALTQMVLALEVMTARYRIADGRGGTRISAANNCAQDSSQALYAAIRAIERFLRLRADVQSWREQLPAESTRIGQLLALGEDLRKMLLPFGAARADWQWGAATLGCSLADSPMQNLGMALRTWRTMLPSIAVRCVAEVFAQHGASMWVLRSHQVGGHDPDIAPRIPNV